MRISRGVLTAFVAPCLPIAALGLPLVVYLPPYYASHLGLSLSVVGTIFLIARLIDVPLDPWFGHLIDRTRSRWGRFRPWFAFGTAVLMAGAYMVFMAKPGISAAVALAGLLVLYIGYSFVYLSHTSWGATLTDDYHERSRLFGWWQATNIAGILAILVVPPLVLGMVGSSDPGAGVHAMGWIIIIGLPLTVAINLIGVPERAAKGHEEHSIRDMLAVARIPLLRRLLWIDLLASMGPGIAGALFLFYFQSAKGYSAQQASTLLLFYFSAGLVGAPLWIWLARKTSKHRAMVVALVAYAALQGVLVFLLPPGNMLLAGIGIALAGLPYAATPFLIRAMLADVSDAETLRSGRESTGLFYAAMTAVTKIGYALPVGLTYPLLGLFGFDAKLGTGNTAFAILGLTLLFTIPPAMFALAAAWLSNGWPIDAKAQAETAARLAGAQTAAAEDLPDAPLARPAE